MAARSRKKKNGLYEFLVNFPERCYPFSYTVRGKRIRWSRSYQHELERALKRYGSGHFGYKLVAYRQVFHLLGSVLFIVFSATVSQYFFGNQVALYVLLAAAILAITFQEFYLHPRRYGQLLPKGIIDWLAWVVPIGLYVFMFIR